MLIRALKITIDEKILVADSSCNYWCNRILFAKFRLRDIGCSGCTYDNFPSEAGHDFNMSRAFHTLFDACRSKIFHEKQISFADIKIKALYGVFFI